MQENPKPQKSGGSNRPKIEGIHHSFSTSAESIPADWRGQTNGKGMDLGSRSCWVPPDETEDDDDDVMNGLWGDWAGIRG